MTVSTYLDSWIIMLRRTCFSTFNNIHICRLLYVVPCLISDILSYFCAAVHKNSPFTEMEVIWTSPRLSPWAPTDSTLHVFNVKTWKIWCSRTKNSGKLCYSFVLVTNMYYYSLTAVPFYNQCQLIVLWDVLFVSLHVWIVFICVSTTKKIQFFRSLSVLYSMMG